MLKFISSEFYKLSRKKSIYVLMALELVIVFLISYLLKDLMRVIYNPMSDNPIYLITDRLNAPIAILTEINLLIIIILIPVFVSSSIAKEKMRGELRIIQSRGVKKGVVITAKYIYNVILCGINIVYIGICSVISAMIFYKPTKQSGFILIKEKLNVSDSIIYNIKFFLIFFSICIVVISLVTVINVIISNNILAILCSLAAIIGTVYLSDFIGKIIIKSGDYAFEVIRDGLTFQVISISIIIAVILIVISNMIYGRQDYTF